ncbi:hypothetical protein DM02DRAFT_635366 [Periconia macrospinosa]|uniref:Glycine zipper 2TM domain-containing protein n=1 Tax=Periconia macrospinosa TaxID=97972 RepID=A0A2V1D469_9PLEO|nr:hypothetical protein DM02DRAFT_635366 [Periconia macrospinosa]
MSEYEDLVELGFEGVDKFATKYHDVVADKVGKTKWFRGKAKKNKEDDRRSRARSVGVRDGGGDEFIGSGSPSHRYKRDEPLAAPEDHLRGFHTRPQEPGQRPEQQREYPPFVATAQSGADRFVRGRGQPLLPPPAMAPQIPHYHYPRALDPSSQYYSPPQRPRALSDPGEYSSDSNSIVSLDKGQRHMYDTYSAAERTAEGWKDDVRRGMRADDIYERDAGEQDAYHTSDGHRMIEMDREFSRRHEDRDDRRRDYSRDGDFEKRIVEERAYYRTTPEGGAVVRRDAAWAGAVVLSKLKIGKANLKQPRAPDADRYRTIGTIVGALAGGIAGSQVKKGEKVPNAMATVAGAVVGGFGAREAEKAIERNRDQRRREEAWRYEEREERRARRRSDREYDYERR